MDAQKVHLDNFDPIADNMLVPGNHKDAVTIDGLDDLFQWASEMVADGNDGKVKRAREQKIRRNVLEMIQKSKEKEAQEKFSEEIGYLQKRVIALLQVVSDKTDEISVLKQIVVSQYFTLQQIPELEKEVKQLRSMTWYRDEAEEERKQLLTALSKLKKERDVLEELLQVNETENERLVYLLKEARSEAERYRNRRWWQRVAAVFQTKSKQA